MKTILDVINVKSKDEMIQVLADAITVLNISEILQAHKDALKNELNNKSSTELKTIIQKLSKECKSNTDEFLWNSAIIKELIK